MMSAGRKENVTPGKRMRQFFAQYSDVAGRRLVIFLELDLDVTILGADGASAVVGHINTAARHPHIVHEGGKVLGRDDLADCLLNLGKLA